MASRDGTCPATSRPLQRETGAVLRIAAMAQRCVIGLPLRCCSCDDDNQPPSELVVASHGVVDGTSTYRVGSRAHWVLACAHVSACGWIGGIGSIQAPHSRTPSGIIGVENRQSDVADVAAVRSGVVHLDGGTNRYWNAVGESRGEDGVTPIIDTVGSHYDTRASRSATGRFTSRAPVVTK